MEAQTLCMVCEKALGKASYTTLQGIRIAVCDEHMNITEAFSGFWDEEPLRRKAVELHLPAQG
ncbi:MAG: hypothetical protein HY368_01505 [Candidatus Aenigmarchaeota archaeon]|nr:hypothetical protein [Candidatus Aenigmarchaeota archaeon]